MKILTKALLCVALCSLAACHNKQNDSVVNKQTLSSAPQSKNMNQFQRLKQLPTPAPVAKRVPSERNYHGNVLQDPYFWMKDQGYPKVDDEDVLSYLKEENAYHKSFLDPHEGLVNTVFEEFKGRTDETEESVPYIENGYEYRWFYREGEEYRTRSRKNLETGKEAIFLDETSLAKGHKYFVLGGWAISPDNRYLAYSFDTAGDERYQVKIKDLETDSYLDDVLNDVQGSVAYSSDGKSLVYSLLEQERWHSKELKVHVIGEPQKNDRTLYQEDDDGYFIGFYQTSSKEFFVINSSQGEVQESYVVSSDLKGDLVPMVSRKEGFQQRIDHAHGHFYMLANDTHTNFRLARTADSQPATANWQTVQEGSDADYLLSLQAFDGFIAMKSRSNGFEKIELIDYPADLDQDLKRAEINFPESVFTASIGINPEFKTNFLRVNYESMITPDTTFDYQVDSKLLTTRKVKKVPSGYDKDQYDTERLMITARDGVDIPVTIVYKKGFKKDASHPMWLYGYGAYSSTVTPNFSTLRLSALDRGFSFAIAHVRGGSMMSYQWYLDGKLKKRENTFNDFVDVAKGLVERNYVAAGNISASGRSAGGELMGAVTIQAPDLWRSINLGVPFVDVLNTMLDATLPLTPPEWKEWGNPIASAEDYALIQSYSPYDNIAKRDYPPMYVSGGLNDPRVTYWEPAKWTAKMRELKTDDNLLVMRINMGAGHFANSGRYGRLKDYAEEYAFMFLAHGINQ
ncbi:S9 family peptidase [Arenicella sp. 4NH20-0111]|uniref:S9 family peptidase n=1 Tax=Arenicella sp. 4NH20-0111 TaxID=3127648 RepID=UPI003106369B